MESASLPKDEYLRLQELLQYQILDTEAEKTFDELTFLASTICETPISLISLIDSERQWFKSHHGLEAEETPRNFAFCTYTILSDKPFVVEDARKDKRFHDNPLVIDKPHVIFYAGIPLTTPRGHNLGTLCVIDHNPRKISQQQLTQLSIIANQVISQLELRKLIRYQHQQHDDLKCFSYSLAHDLKAPLRNMMTLTSFIKDDIAKRNFDQLDHNSTRLVERSRYMTSLIKNTLEYFISDDNEKLIEDINLTQTISDIQSNISSDKKVNFNIQKTLPCIKGIKGSAHKIFQNLTDNAIKYCDKETVEIDISFTEINNYYHFLIQDNGMGIPLNEQDKVFNLLYRGSNAMEHKSSTGIGLSICRRLVALNGGNISLTSTPHEGTCFSIQWPYSPLSD